MSYIYKKKKKMSSNQKKFIGDYDPNTKILIDSAYFMFNCFTELKKSEQFKNIKLPNDVFENKKFVRLFEKKIENNFYRLSTNFNVHFRNFVFIRDCSRSDIWRNKLFDKYKKHRPKDCTIKSVNQQTGNYENQRYNISNLFRHIYNHYIIYENDNRNKSKMDIHIRKNITIIQKSDKLEADDVISHIAYMRDSIEKNSIIISEDTDFLQSCSEYTELYNLKFENLKIKYSSRNVMFEKIIYGDKSDNISGIEKMNQSSNIIECLENISLTKLCKNIQLIDFHYVPIQYIKKLNETSSIVGTISY